MKSRLLKYVLTGLFFLTLGGLWAFSHFFFNPFEGSWKGKLGMLVPRDVEFFVSRDGLRRDFDPFPRPRALAALEADDRGQALLALEPIRQTLASVDLVGIEEELQRNLSQLPIDVDPLDVFGGREVCVAGTFAGTDLTQANWAVYGRTNWMGKLGVEALRKELVDLGGQGLQVGEIEDGFSIAGGNLPKPLYVTRLLDVVVISTDASMIEAVRVLDRARGEDSFFNSAKYQNHAADVTLDGDKLEAYLNQNAYLRAAGLPGTWPPPRSEALAERLLSRLFQLGHLREYALSATFDNGLTFDASGKISSENLTQLQRKAYRMRGQEKAAVLEFARMAPADVGVFAFAQLPLNEVLTEAADALEPATLELLEGPARDVFGYSDIYPLIGDISASLGDRFAYFVRDHDYPVDTSVNAPPADDAKTTVWAVAFEIDDDETLQEVRERIKGNPSAFGIQGRNPATGGVFQNEVSGGGVVYEFHSPFVPGTGHLATLEMFGPRGVKYFLLSNHHQMLGQVFQAYRGRSTPLADDPSFQTLVNTGLANADAVLWLAPRKISSSMRQIAEHEASLDVGLAIDWSLERPRIERQVLKDSFPGETYGAVSPENLESFELLVQAEVDRFESEFVAQYLPKMRRDYLRRWEALELTTATLLELSLDQKDFRLYGRVVVPLEEE